MKSIILIVFTVLLSSNLAAKKKYELLTEKDGVSVYTKMKLNKDGKQQIWIKFKNKSGSTQNMNLELGYYLVGTLEEMALVASCSKSSFFARLSPPIYGLVSEDLSNEQLLDTKFELKALEFKLEKTETCEKQH